MAGGANSKFIERKEEFLRNNVIDVQVSDGELMIVATGHVDATKATLATTGRVQGSGQAVGVAAKDKTAGVFDFDLFKTGETAEVVENGRTSRVPRYLLKAWGTKARDKKQVGQTVQYKTPTFAHPIRAYWVPWSANSSWSVQLGNAADFFFTATMDGCSLAISSGAAPVVTHGNYRSVVNPDRASALRTIAEMASHHTTNLNTDVAKILSKDQYAATHQQKLQGINNLVTVVGFRDTIHNTWSFYWQRRKVILGDRHQGTHTRMVLQDRLVPLV
jgi:hypothetical protein